VEPVEGIPLIQGLFGLKNSSQGSVSQHSICIGVGGCEKYLQAFVPDRFAYVSEFSELWVRIFDECRVLQI
jgi:hypothetical protein